MEHEVGNWKFLSLFSGEQNERDAFHNETFTENFHWCNFHCSRNREGKGGGEKGRGKRDIGLENRFSNCQFSTL